MMQGHSIIPDHQRPFTLIELADEFAALPAITKHLSVQRRSSGWLREL